MRCDLKGVYYSVMPNQIIVTDFLDFDVLLCLSIPATWTSYPYSRNPALLCTAATVWLLKKAKQIIAHLGTKRKVQD